MPDLLRFYGGFRTWGILVLLAGLAHAGGLRETLVTAVEQHLLTRAALETTAEADARRAAAAHVYHPTLGLVGSWQYTSEVPRLELDFPPGVPPLLAPRDLGTNEQRTLGLQVNWLLFDGGRGRNGKRGAEVLLQQKKLETVSRERELALTLVRLWRSAQMQMLAREAVDAGLRRVAARAGQLRQLLAQDLAIPLDTLEISELANDLRRRGLELDRQIQDLRRQLAEAAGRTVSLEELRPTRERIEIPAEFHFQLQGLPRWRLLDVPAKLAQLEEAGVKSEYYPQVFLQGGLLYGRPGADPLADAWMTWETAALNLKWELWDWNRRRHLREAARKRGRSLELQRRETERQLRLRFDQALRTLDFLRREDSLLTRDVELARYRVEILEEQLAAEQISQADYTEALEKLVAAEITRAGHQVRIQLQVTEIEYCSGKDWKEWELGE